MKKIYFMLSAALLSAACAKETDTARETVEEGLVDYVFSACGDDSKTTFNGTDFIWTPGDRISVFDSSLKNRRFETSDNTAKATFTGRAKPSSAFYAFYPYDASLVMSEPGILNVNIPSRQTVPANSIADGMNLCVGKMVSDSPIAIDGASFLMKNVCGYVRINLGQSSVPLIGMKITAPGGEGISGGVTLDYTGDVPVTTPDETVPVVGLVPEDESFQSGTYYAVVNPVSLSKGLNLKLMRKDYRTVEIPIDCSSIVRNSARATTFDIPSPDELKWVEPAKYELHVEFVDTTKTNLQLKQPFEEPMPAVGNPPSDLVEAAFHLPVTGEEFFFSSKMLNINSSSGLRLEPGAYILLPAIPGKSLSKVSITYGLNSPTKSHSICITPDEDNAEPIPGGETQTLGPNAVGTVYTWNLQYAAEGVGYRIANKSIMNEFRARFIDLEYIGLDNPAVKSVSLTSTSLEKGKIHVSGNLNVQFPESGYFSWGLEYREEGISEWRKGPSGTGTTFDATIDNIDESKVWCVRAYGRADADENVYSAERKIVYLKPIVITINKFGYGKKGVEYNGTETGGHFLLTSDRTGYTFPIDKASARINKSDEYSYYAESTDTEPLMTGIVFFAPSGSNGYYISGEYAMMYSGYIQIPGRRDYRITKVVCTVHAGGAVGKNIVATTTDATSSSRNVIGQSPNYSVANQKEALPINCDGKTGEGVRVWGKSAMYWDAVEVTYAP